jgi:hypothetical protein
MPGIKTDPSTLSTRSAAAHHMEPLRRWRAPATASVLLIACAAPAQLDLGYDESALQVPNENATPVEVDPDALQATIVQITGEGVLCPPGSLGIAIAASGSLATVILSEAAGGVQTAGCVLTFALDVPEGLELGMPTTILRGVSLGRTNLERRYSFEGAGASNAFIDLPAEDFISVDRSDQIESGSCGTQRRVNYKVDVTAQILDESTFFQLDSVDLDTTYRSGTDWRLCDRNQRLVAPPGEAGDFCDGSDERPCAEGLRCDLEINPSLDEGVCSEP